MFPQSVETLLMIFGILYLVYLIAHFLYNVHTLLKEFKLNPLLADFFGLISSLLFIFSLLAGYPNLMLWIWSENIRAEPWRPEPTDKVDARTLKKIKKQAQEELLAELNLVSPYTKKVVLTREDYDIYIQQRTEHRQRLKEEQERQEEERMRRIEEKVIRAGGHINISLYDEEEEKRKEDELARRAQFKKILFSFIKLMLIIFLIYGIFLVILYFLQPSIL